MKKYFLQAAILPGIIIGFSAGISLPLQDHNVTITTPKSLTAKDKAVIVQIFNEMIFEDEYRMEFDNKEVYGKKELPDGYVNALRTGKITDDLPSTWLYQTLQPKAGFWFFTNKPKALGMDNVFGKANAAKLQAIINKYSGGK